MDNGVTTRALITSTIAMASASLVYPATYGDLLIGAGTFIRGAKLLSKVNVKDVKLFLAQDKELKNKAIGLTAFLNKSFAKNLPKNCFDGVLTGSAFHTQGFYSSYKFMSFCIS